MKNEMGNRMKQNYENRQRFYLTRRMPVIIRVDGRAFHTYTRGFKKPFDEGLIKSMVESAKKVAADMQGFKVAYIQSDEVSFLLTDFDNLETDAWFDYNKAKLESISASMMTAYFNKIMPENTRYVFKKEKIAFFDARAFNIPREEVTNYFLWRAKDWERNSLAMYCASMFSAKELHGKNDKQRHDMLHEEGKNWVKDCNDVERNGTFLVREKGAIVEKTSIFPLYYDIDTLMTPFLYEE